MTDPTIQIAEVQRRYRLCAGQILLARELIELREGESAYSDAFVASRVVDVNGNDREVLGPTSRGAIAQAFEPWGTVLMIGEKFKETDYRPELTIGQRVYFSTTGSRDIVLEVGDEKMTVTKVPFEAIILIDDGEAVSA